MRITLPSLFLNHLYNGYGITGILLYQSTIAACRADKLRIRYDPRRKKVIDLECSINGQDWRIARFVELRQWHEHPYAVVIQNIAIGFFDSAKHAEKFRKSLEWQLGKIALVLALAGASPRVVMVRRPVHEIEVIDARQ